MKQVPRPEYTADPCYLPTTRRCQASLQNPIFCNLQEYLFGHTVYLHAIFK